MTKIRYLATEFHFFSSLWIRTCNDTFRRGTNFTPTTIHNVYFTLLEIEASEKFEQMKYEFRRMANLELR